MNVKKEGKENNLLELIAERSIFHKTLEELLEVMDPARYVGRAPLQVEQFLKNDVRPVLEENRAELGVEAEIKV